MQALPRREQASYLVFALRGTLYAVPAATVVEAIWLPELTPMPAAPNHVAGLVNVRGQVVPVTDLALRLGLPPRQYRLSDSVILLEGDDAVVGLLVDEVREVCTIQSDDIQPAPRFDDGQGVAVRFATGVAMVNDGIVSLLDLTVLLQQPAQARELPAGPEAAPPLVREDLYAEVSPEEREIFRGRALSLRESAETHDVVGLTPLAVVELSAEYYGLELGTIREFTRVGEITPVPCCPPHIVGNINLRGEVLTLVDVRGALGVARGNSTVYDRAVVVEIDDLCVGVLVDEVHDVAYLHPGDVSTVPTALRSGGNEHITGTAHHGEKTLGILDLRTLFNRENLIVDDEA